MEHNPSDFRDWAFLPRDMVELISEKARSVADFVRFRAVCSHWRQFSTEKPRHLPSQLPWVLLPLRPDKEVYDFYDFWESKTREIKLPETTIDMTCCASDRGWLLLVGSEGRDVFLLNPLTNARIGLPPIGIRPDLFGNPPTLSPSPSEFPIGTQPMIDLGRLEGQANFRFYDHAWYRRGLGTFSIGKVIISSDPAEDPNCRISVFPTHFEKSRGFLTCQFGDPDWREITSSEIIFHDATYFNGLFYLIRRGSIVVLDLSDMRASEFLDSALTAYSVFVEDKSGVYVAVLDMDVNGDKDWDWDGDFYRDGDADMDFYWDGNGNKSEDDDQEKEDDDRAGDEDKARNMPKFVLYQFQEEPYKLVQVDTKNTVLFSGTDTSPYLAICSDDWESVDGDSLYMVWSTCTRDEPYFHRLMTKFDNQSEGYETEVLVESHVSPASINQLNQTAPMWFQPNL